jgi:divalent metal cation (Fe/Co/Zn/Cd) transporter
VPVSRERLALRLIAVSFFALATYVSIDAARALLSSHDPDASGVGIGLAMLSLLVMPWLSWA